jgi:predicted AAA+ superfamily ATPase
LYENKKIKFDIYITGSNAKLLSTELSTLLTGRHTDIHVMPLSFKEFIELSDSKYKENPALLDYLKIGGLGVIIPILNDYKQISEVLKDIFNDTITKDIKHRHKNQNNLLINKIIEYVYTNIGKQINPENIINYLVSKKEGTFDKKTINNYLT